MRFLQVSIEVMTRDRRPPSMIKQHDPKLRNDLLMLLGGQTFETLSSREGKEQLRTESLKAVADVIARRRRQGRERRAAVLHQLRDAVTRTPCNRRD